MSRRYSYKGYVIERGDYVGTPSDRIDGWYLALKGSTVVDHRGRGFMTIAEAKREVNLREIAGGEDRSVCLDMAGNNGTWNGR